jgi:hypothetical protein
MNKIQDCLAVCQKMDELELELKSLGQDCWRSKEMQDYSQQYEQLYETMTYKEKMAFIVEIQKQVTNAAKNSKL